MTQNIFILGYPQLILDLYEVYPVSLETLVIDWSILADKQKLLLTDKDSNLQFIQPSPKLIPNLRSRKDWVLHYKNLKLCTRWINIDEGINNMFYELS